MPPPAVRIEPPRVECPHADRCAGCPAIELDYAAQLARKHDRVHEALARYPALAALAVDGVAGASEVAGYRARAKLVHGPGFELGLFAKGKDHVVADIPECPVMAPALRRAAGAVREVLRAGGVHTRAVDLREAVDPASGEARVMVTLVLDARRPVAREAIDRITTDVAHRGIDLVATSEAGPAARVLGGGHRIVHGEGVLPDRIDGPLYALAAPGAFVQAHRVQAARAYRALGDGLARALGSPGSLRGMRVIDAFAGSGAIGFALANRGARVLAIEVFAPAAALAERAAREQGLDVTVRANDAEDELERLAAERTPVDAIVLDPPRRGLTAALRIAAARLAPRAIAYLSCEPRSLARDLDHFARLGFAAPAIAAFDLMPQTDEVEALAILVPRDPPPPRVLDRDATWIAIDKSPHEPTTPQGGRLRSLLERVQALAPELARAAPLHRLDEGTSGVCLFAIRPEHAAEVASTMQGKTYLALCRGITREKGTIARPLKIEGKRVEARTRYKRKAVVSGHSLVEVRIETGRTHQIRRHMASIGHPILGDERYGDRASNRHLLEKHLLDRPFLHAASINVAGRAIESSLAPDLEAVLCSLRASDLTEATGASG